MNAWPTPAQETLLRAALGDLEAYDRYVATTLDEGSRRLLPLLYRTVSPHRPASDLLSEARREYLNTWRINQTWFHRLRVILEWLSASGLPVMLLKGAALTLQAYGDMGVRPLGDVDIAVPRARARDALRLFRDRGFHGVNVPIDPDIPDCFLSAYTGRDLVDDADMRVDLHWNPLLLATMPAVGQVFWGHSVEAPGYPARIPSPTDTLLHVLVHGLRYDRVPPIRWVSDAATLIRQTSIDWDRLWPQAVEWGLTLPVMHGLRYLQDRFALPIPPLRDHPAPWYERVSYQTQLLPYEERRAFGVLCYRYATWRRSEVSSWPVYLRGVFGAESYGELFRRGMAVLRRSQDRRPVDGIPGP